MDCGVFSLTLNVSPLTGSFVSLTYFDRLFVIALGQPPQQTMNRLSLTATRGDFVASTLFPAITGQYISPFTYFAGSLTNAVGQSPQQKDSFWPFTVSVTVLSVGANLWPLTG